MPNSRLYKGIVELPVISVIINATVTGGDNTLVAAVAGKKIQVLALAATAIVASSIQLQDGAAGTNLSGVIGIATNTSYILPFSEVGWLETSAGTLLNAAIGAEALGGVIVYTLV